MFFYFFKIKLKLYCNHTLLQCNKPVSRLSRCSALDPPAWIIQFGGSATSRPAVQPLCPAQRRSVWEVSGHSERMLRPASPATHPSLTRGF